MIVCSGSALLGVDTEVGSVVATTEEGALVVVGEIDGWDDDGLPVGNIDGSWFIVGGPEPKLGDEGSPTGEGTSDVSAGVGLIVCSGSALFVEGLEVGRFTLLGAHS